MCRHLDRSWGYGMWKDLAKFFLQTYLRGCFCTDFDNTLGVLHIETRAFPLHHNERVCFLVCICGVRFQQTGHHR